MNTDQLREKVKEFTSNCLGEKLPVELSDCTEDSFEVKVKDGFFNSDRQQCIVMRYNEDDDCMEAEMGEEFYEVDEVGFLRILFRDAFIGDLYPET